MIKTLNLNWHRSINFGDQLNPYLVKKIWDYEPVKINEGVNVDHLMMIGSILNEANSNSLVFGSGFVSPESFFIGNPQILSVRGELTRKILSKRGYKESEIKVGDPAILLPDFYKPVSNHKKYSLGIIPHIIDYDRASKMFENIEGCHIIDLRLTGNDIEEIENIIDQIVSCDSIISSSLHGLIVAHSYGIPGSWCEFSDMVIGKGFKFRDYFSAHDFEGPVEYTIDFKGPKKIDRIEDIINLSSSSMVQTWKDKPAVYDILKDVENRFKINKIIH